MNSQLDKQSPISSLAAIQSHELPFLLGLDSLGVPAKPVAHITIEDLGDDDCRKEYVYAYCGNVELHCIRVDCGNVLPAKQAMREWLHAHGYLISESY